MATQDRTALSRWQIPDRPPRRRERSRWRRPPELLLIVGIALIAAGVLVTLGLPFDLGGTDSVPPGADGSDGAADGGVTGEEAREAVENDDTESIQSVRGAVDEAISGEDDREMENDENREECLVG